MKGGVEEWEVDQVTFMACASLTTFVCRWPYLHAQLHVSAGDECALYGSPTGLHSYFHDERERRRRRESEEPDMAGEASPGLAVYSVLLQACAAARYLVLHLHTPRHRPRPCRRRAPGHPCTCHHQFHRHRRPGHGDEARTVSLHRLAYTTTA